MDYARENLRLHGERKGKITLAATVPANDREPVPGLYPQGGPRHLEKSKKGMKAYFAAKKK